MNAIAPIAETADTVTLRRTDYERLRAAIEDAEDRAAVAEIEAREAAVGKVAARANYLPVELAIRVLDGEHPVRIWREHRGLSAQTLADRAGIARSYITEIETRRKPGSAAALRRLATFLSVTVDDLLPAATEAAQPRVTRQGSTRRPM
jgi:ribosome-binding protein aMBF1 (putative translation factor)